MSSTGPELLGSNQRPERVSIPTFYFLQERTYLRHQTHYALFLVKQTILLYYRQADQQALDLVQSKALYGGVLVDQIMQTCHWKAHTHFQLSYLKDLSWSDNNMYLVRVTAA